MAVGHNGVCSACRGDILAYPALKCPWCLVVRHHDMARRLEVDPSLDPITAIEGVRAREAILKEETGQIHSIRAEAARAILTSEDPVAGAKALHVTLAMLHKWATRDSEETTCKAGHSKRRYGYVTSAPGAVATVWACRKCETALTGPPPKTPERPKDEETLRARWALHVQNQAAAAAALDDRLGRPRNLRAPLPSALPSLDVPPSRNP